MYANVWGSFEKELRKIVIYEECTFCFFIKPAGNGNIQGKPQGLKTCEAPLDR